MTDRVWYVAAVSAAVGGRGVEYTMLAGPWPDAAQAAATLARLEQTYQPPPGRWGTLTTCCGARAGNGYLDDRGLPLPRPRPRRQK